MRKILVALFVFPVLVVTFSHQAFAKSAFVESSTITQVKKVRGDKRSMPTSEYFTMGLTGNSPATADIDLRIFSEPREAINQFDLYQAKFHVEPNSYLQIDGGRQWLPDGFSTPLVDGVKIKAAPESWKVGLSLYAGVPRSIEQTDWNPDSIGFTSGLMLNLLQAKNTNGQLSFRYNRLDTGQSDIPENDTISGALALSHSFSGKWSPEAYSNVEYDFASKTLEAGSLGFDLYPHWRLAVNFEGSYYDVNRDSIQTNVFGKYAQDELMQGRMAAELKLGHGLRFFDDLSFQRFDAPTGEAENTFLAEAGFGHYAKGPKLSTTATYYYSKGYGGNVHGGMLELKTKHFKHFTPALNLDVSRYSKVTNQKETAISVVGGILYQLKEKMSLMLGGEYNRNNWFDNEGRVTLQFNIAADSGDKATTSLLLPKSVRSFHEI